MISVYIRVDDIFCAGRLARVERCDASAGVGCDPATDSRKSPWRARQAAARLPRR